MKASTRLCCNDVADAAQSWLTSSPGEELTMATDYDTPRKTDEELAEDSIEDLKARRAEKSSALLDIDEAELAETLELPGADLSDERLTVEVLPRQADEFTCSKCFLVHHRSQLDHEDAVGPVCTECS
jgi:hypothetical protein